MWQYITRAMHSSEWESYPTLCLFSKLSQNAWVPDGQNRKEKSKNQKLNKVLEKKVRVIQIDGLWRPQF